MRNAKAEIMAFIRDRGDVIAAQIVFNPASQVVVDYQFRRGDNWELLDFDYDAGYGTQHVFGTIWFQDGSWATRREVDGSEWWQHHMRPQIPENLLR